MSGPLSRRGKRGSSSTSVVYRARLSVTEPSNTQRLQVAAGPRRSRRVSRLGRADDDDVADRRHCSVPSSCVPGVHAASRPPGCLLHVPPCQCVQPILRLRDSPQVPACSPVINLTHGGGILLLHSMYGLRPALHTAGLPAACGRPRGCRSGSVHGACPWRTDGLWPRAARRAAWPSCSGAESPSGPCTDGGLVYAGFSLGAAGPRRLALPTRMPAACCSMHGSSDLPEDASTEIPVQLPFRTLTPRPADWA